MDTIASSGVFSWGGVLSVSQVKAHNTAAGMGTP